MNLCDTSMGLQRGPGGTGPSREGFVSASEIGNQGVCYSYPSVSLSFRLDCLQSIVRVCSISLSSVYTMNSKIQFSLFAVLLALMAGLYFSSEEDLQSSESVSASQKEALESESVAPSSPVAPDAEAGSDSSEEEAQRVAERPAEDKPEGVKSLAPFSPSDIARSQINNAEPGREQWRLILEYYSKGMGVEQAKQELQYWRSEPDSWGSLLAMSLLYKRWAEAEEPLVAVKEALLLSASIPGDDRRKAVLSAGAFRILGLEEPQEAISFLKDSNYTAMLMETLAMRSGRSNIATNLVGEGRWEELAQWADGWEGVQGGEEVARGKSNFYAAVGTKLAEGDFRQAEAVLSQLPDESLRVDAMSSFAMAKAAESPMEAAEWVRNLDTLNGAQKGQVLAGQIEGWAKQEGGYLAAFDYVAGMDESVDLDPSLLKLLEATPSDQYQTRMELMESIEDPSLRDDATATFVRSSPGLGPQNRLDVALSIESTSVREETIRQLVYDVWREDQDAANAMMVSLKGKNLDIGLGQEKGE